MRWIRMLAVFVVLAASGGWSVSHAARAYAAGCDGDIVYGERITCDLTTTTQVRDLTFTGAVGDRIRARVITTAGTINPVASIRFGAVTVCAPTFADDFTCALTSTGTQTLRVDANGSGDGSFVTTIQRLNDPSSCPSIGFGPAGKVGKIGQKAELDCFARSGGSVGQRYFVRVVETSAAAATLVVEVVRPDGSTVCAPTASTDSVCVLDAAGTNRVFVYDASGLQTTDYRVVLERFPNPVGCTVQAFGTPVTATFDDPGEVGCYTFTGSAGDRIRLRTIPSAGSVNPVTEVLRPDGTSVCPLSFADDLTCTLDVSGKHTVLVRDAAGAGAGTGTVELGLERLNDPSSCPSIGFGPTGTVGVIGQRAELDCFARSGGSVGQRYFVRVVETSAAAATLVVEVVRPDGSTVCAPTGSTDSVCVLDAAGTNRVFVYDASGLQTTDYRVVLERFPNPVGCTPKAIGDPAQIRPINDPGEIDCVTFTGSASQDVRIQAAPTSGTINPVTEVLRPDGTTVCGPTFADDFVCDLDGNGKHTVIVRDAAGTGSSTGNYSLRLLAP